MSKDVLPIEIRGVVPASAGVAIFVGNDKKVFIINVDPYIGDVIVKLMNGVQRERPLTHDLLGSVFKGFGIAVERVVITELKNATYFARLILKQQNELGQAIVELDARPSDCLALAIAQKKPILVSKALFTKVEDMSELLARISTSGRETE
jgi:bifunctional DNase/RNase